MTKQLRHQAFIPLHDLLTSDDFWHGVIDGFAPQKFILGGCDSEELRGKGDSAYQAWVDVGNLLTLTISEFDHYDAETSGSTTKKPAKNNYVRAS